MAGPAEVKVRFGGGRAVDADGVSHFLVELAFGKKNSDVYHERPSAFASRRTEFTGVFGKGGGGVWDHEI